MKKLNIFNKFLKLKNTQKMIFVNLLTATLPKKNLIIINQKLNIYILYKYLFWIVIFIIIILGIKNFIYLYRYYRWYYIEYFPVIKLHNNTNWRDVKKEKQAVETLNRLIKEYGNLTNYNKIANVIALLFAVIFFNVNCYVFLYKKL